MNISEIEWWRERDLNPPKGYTPVLELRGRKLRLEYAKQLALENKKEVPENPTEATAFLFNLYYDVLLASSDIE